MARLTLSDDQLERYSRQIVLREIGGAGQARLLGAHIAIIGAGGIGAPALQYCAAAGIGHVRLIDNDRVDLSNLHRQILFGTGDVGRDKVAASVDAIARTGADAVIEPVVTRIDSGNVDALLDGIDVVIDGSDNFATRLIVADAAYRARVPLVAAAVGQFDGQLGVFRGWEPHLPCYRCWVGDAPERDGVSCADAGILGALTGVMGSLAALEAIRAIVPFGEDPAGRILLCDLASLRFRSVALPPDPGCPTCGAGEGGA